MIRRCSLSLREEDADWKTILRLQAGIFVPEDHITTPYKNSKKQVWWIATWHRRPVGFCSLAPAQSYDYAFLPLIGILPSHRGKGLFSQLINGVTRHCQQNGLVKVITYISASNNASLNAFVKEGYRFYTPEHPYVGDQFLYLYLDT